MPFRSLGTPEIDRWSFDDHMLETCGLQTSLLTVDESVTRRIADKLHPQTGEVSIIDMLAGVRRRLEGLDPESDKLIDMRSGPQIPESEVHRIAVGAVDSIRERVNGKVRHLSYEYQLEDLLIKNGTVPVWANKKLMKAAKIEYEYYRLWEYWKGISLEDPDLIGTAQSAEAMYRRAARQFEAVRRVAEL